MAPVQPGWTKRPRDGGAVRVFALSMGEDRTALVVSARRDASSSDDSSRRSASLRARRPRRCVTTRFDARDRRWRGATARFARLRVTVTDPGGFRHFDGVDAVVIGSAICYGKWLRPALRFLHEHEAELAARPVWLFSSGRSARRRLAVTGWTRTPRRSWSNERCTRSSRLRQPTRSSHAEFPGLVDRLRCAVADRRLSRLDRSQRVGDEIAETLTAGRLGSPPATTPGMF